MGKENGCGGCPLLARLPVWAGVQAKHPIPTRHGCCWGVLRCVVLRPWNLNSMDPIRNDMLGCIEQQTLNDSRTMLVMTAAATLVVMRHATGSCREVCQGACAVTWATDVGRVAAHTAAPIFGLGCFSHV